MKENITIDIMEKWLKGWCLLRRLPLPVKFTSGFKVAVGHEKQKTRYVFPDLNHDFKALATSITEPWVFLKVCAAPEELNFLPQRWVMQPQGYLMTCLEPMVQKQVPLPKEYHLVCKKYNTTWHIQIKSNDGTLAANGRIVLVDEVAVYDRIATDTNHRRKGLATLLMFELQKIAVAHGVFKNILVATEEGKRLYTSLGWQVYSLYTSVVIPGNETNNT